MKGDKLTAKQAAFIREYTKDFNGTQAAIRAGYSAKTAQEIAAQNLSKLIIQKAITESLKKVEKRTEITVDMVVKKLAMIGFAKIGDMDVKVSDQTKALDLLGKHLGMFTQKVEVTGKDGQPIDINTIDAGDVRSRLLSVAAAEEATGNTE